LKATLLESSLTATSLFPLPLTAFEAYMVTDDRRDYPMTFFIELVLAGSLDRSALEAALAKALTRHPLLTARIVRRGGRWHWVEGIPSSEVDWTEGDVRYPRMGDRQIDLTRESSVRVAVGRTAERARIVVQFHHAATDGIGAIQFLGDALAFYAQATASAGEELPETDPLDARCLRIRGQLWSPDQRPPHLLRDFTKRFLHLISRYPAGVATPDESNDGWHDAARSPFVTRILERKTLNALKSVGTACGVTQNELYLLAMLCTLRGWNADHGRTTTREFYQIFIPATFRTPAHDASPAANLLSYLWIGRHGRELTNLRDVLHGIHDESQARATSDDSRYFALGLQEWGRVPGGLWLGATLPLRFCTAVLANVGDVRRQFRARFPLSQGKIVAGSVVLEELLGAAPVRPGTHLASSLGTYAGRLFINFNCDPRHFAPMHAEQFADRFVGQLLSLGDEVGTSTQPLAEAA
jgi:NRPS condensation-like uncharacterized protein